MGAFGLVWYDLFRPCTCYLSLTTVVQFGKRSADRPSGGSQKDHEAIQHPSSLETNLSRAQASEASAPRECMEQTQTLQQQELNMQRSSA